MALETVPPGKKVGRTMRLEKRLRALEARLISSPVMLYFADGSTRALCGGSDLLVRQLQTVCRGADLTPGQSAELALIDECVRSEEPGGGRMVELLRCLLHARADARRCVAPEVE